jgi:non-specific serine/threonine protein kinase
LSPGALYQLAPKESVVRGYAYYEQQRLQSYVWSADRATLTAWVQGSRLYSVTFSLLDGMVNAECGCPAWNPDWSCKHVLCGYFTTVNLLSPKSFSLPAWQQSRRSALRDELLGDIAGPSGKPDTAQELGQSPGRNGDRHHARTRRMVSVPRDSPPKPRYEIVIDARQPYTRLLIRRDGVFHAGGWGPTLPPELLALLNTSWYSFDLGLEDPLLRYLRFNPQPVPIVLQTGRGETTLRWDPLVKCRSKTELDLVGDEVRIRAVCLADGATLDRIVRFRTFVADVRGGRLLFLEDERGWASFRSLQECFDGINPFLDPYGDLDAGLVAVVLPDGRGFGRWQGINRETEFAVPLDEFRSAQVDLIRKQADRTLQDLLLKVEGQEIAIQRPDSLPEGEAPSYCMILEPPPGAGEDPTAPWTLQLAGRHGDFVCAPSVSTFGFIAALERGRAGSGPLRAQKRKAVLYDTFFKLLDAQDAKERDHRIKTALASGGWSRAVRNEAARWLRQAHSDYARPDARLQIRNGQWALIPIDKAREAVPYRIPFDLFGPRIFYGTPGYDRMTIDAQRLFEHLPALLERLTDAGVPLVCDEVPVRTSRWDCALDVERKAGIDWFEIRPEIRCDGEVVEESVWREAARRGGLVRSRGGLRLLDAASLERLRALAGLSEQGARGRGAERIVRVPRLQIFDWIALREQGVRVTLPAEDEAVIARLLGFERLPETPVPEGLRATLRPYQRDGYGWLAFLHQHRFGACLADDMGLGKTLQAICLLAAIKEGLVRPPHGVGGPHLVVAPTSLLFNWEQELARFSPGLKVHLYTGKERSLEAGDGEVVLTTYGLVRRDIATLERASFHVIVFDEAQAVKNLFADTTGAVRRLKGFFKLAMTGTPVENHLGEYFSIMDLCLPGLLGDYERFAASLKRASGGAPERLLRRTRPFILRRTKEQTLHDLPPKIETEVFLELTDRQKALYQRTVAQVRSTIDEAYRQRTQAQAQLIALTAILKLRQACLSPRLLTWQADELSPKLSFLIERLQILLEEGHSALVFSQFTSFLDLVQEACVAHDIPHNRLDGATALGARKARVTAFQTGERAGVFLLSLKAGGQGLNLTKANYVFHLDPWWNPAVENQASDRAHRIGQKQTVSVMRILMRHTVEEKMMALKQRKLALYEAVMQGAVRGAGHGVLTKADFDFLLSPGAASA